MLYLFFLQFDWQKLRPENILGGQVLERTPAGLSLIYLAAISVLVLLLLISLIRNLRPQFAFERDLPKEVKRKLGTTIANRSLRLWQMVFVLLAFFVFGLHVYWTRYAEESNEQFQALSYKDLRNRRTSAANLRGWMLDRSGNLSSALAFYKRDQKGDIVRTFPLEREMAHLLGTERGTPGLERTLYDRVEDPMPEAWEVFTKIKKDEDTDKKRDVRITIDRDLQQFVAKQLEGKKGGIVVLNPQTGDVLAMYSNPSFSLNEAQTLDSFLRLEADREEKPLLNRATREFYIPGSTFKTFTMLSAFRAGATGLTFAGTPDCWVPFRGSKAICDAGGGCHACGQVDLREGFKVSSNQYFAQLANALGRDRLAETAAVTGIAATENEKDALSQGLFPDIWNVSSRRIANAISPARATIVTGKHLTAFDLGMEGMGQGMAGQMTPFQMALIAAITGNTEGRLMKPKIEADLPPQMFAQVLTPQQSVQVREIMSTVTEEPGGTGGIVRDRLASLGIATGGKTGTAEKDNVPVYNKDGTRKTEKRRRKTKDGGWEEYNEPITRRRTDGWFIVIAPLENPQVAIAVVIEDIRQGQYGGTTAAPVAADVIRKAAELGLLGDRYKSRVQTPTGKPQGRKTR